MLDELDKPRAEVGILILDDDRGTQIALHQMLDSEGWRVQVVGSSQQALAELAGGAWRLMIANVEMSGTDTMLFSMLNELSQAVAVEGGPPPVRALFLVPESAGSAAQQALDRARLPYVLKPFHLHDFLDKISDLLLETGAIPVPIRRVKDDNRGETTPLRDTQRKRGSGAGGRQTTMFAPREDYMMSEEEIAEFERQEAEERKKKPKKPDRLGNP